MSLRLEALTFDTRDPAVPAAFWSGLLRRPAVEVPGGVLVPGDETELGLRFVAGTTQPSGRGLHLHLTSTSLDDQQATVDRALELGGRHVDVGQLPEEGHIVLGDPEGNLLCVIEPGNRFLTGSGYFGEVACDGTREVGLFWRDALGWTLNWDQDGETSINSPLGGTKVSGAAEPIDPKQGRNRQRFDLVSDDRDEDVERLVGLGATRLPDDGWLARPGRQRVHRQLSDPSSRSPTSRTAARSSGPPTTRYAARNSAISVAYQCRFSVVPVSRVRPSSIASVTPRLRRQPAAHLLERRVDLHLDGVRPALRHLLLERAERVEVRRRRERLGQHLDRVTRSMRYIRRASAACDQPSTYHRPCRTTTAHGSTWRVRSRCGPRA